MFWNYLLIICIVCAVLCAVGFIKYVYFLSIGYGFAIAGGGITSLIIALKNGWTESVLWLAVLQAVLFVIYGARLSGFLLVREFKNAGFQKAAKTEIEGFKKLPVFVSIPIWLCVSVLYTAQVSPMFYRYANGSSDYFVPVIGIVISVCGLILESMADKQKTQQKKANPKMVATQGLYKMVRCPNYLGEIIFWTGVFISGLTTYSGIGQWLMAVIAYISIVYIMFNGAQRLEKRQMARYGNDKEYNDYADKTPIIIPFLPIYHLNKKA
ncbi:DUF1295 domain-containing protein [Butyrivibrio sp. DSM 10294]|uniref:DUF1295 domain-containing protein n=1 Tax=Butyrivibrio sp. DSM 10294 TaxID=2972457 RepID=UPI00234EBD15|nr:DUF1295 domain-containing protein [Butyrivibrio sp. DSM 10294]MDC7294676.1 DUF1295 domain-containing protein [Butyrivibrio sp. DSM 10294]